MSAPGDIIQPEHLSPDLTATRGIAGTSSPAVPRGGVTTLAAAVESLERDLIRNALERSRGNISETARALGLTRRGLYLKIRRLGLETSPDLDSR